MIQQIAWQITLVGILSLMGVFAWVFLMSGDRREYGSITRYAYRMRKTLFFAVIFLVTPVFGYTLTKLPYAATHTDIQNNVPVIRVTGHMWYWELSEPSIPVNREVEFQVTSADVNHGFGIYDENMRMLAQTQAMPGYTNKLRYTFERAGTYKILCLEYCGVAHSRMQSEITVVE